MQNTKGLFNEYKYSFIHLPRELCSEQEGSNCIENSVCFLLDGFPLCQCKIGFSGSADAETEGECLPDKNEITIQLGGIKTEVAWEDSLLIEGSKEAYKAKKDIIEGQAYKTLFKVQVLPVKYFPAGPTGPI